MADINSMSARSGKIIRSNNTIVNEADGINADGSRNVQVTGSTMEYFGKSTDVKPTPEKVGSTFFEIDTQVVSMWDGLTWVVI